MIGRFLCWLGLHNWMNVSWCDWATSNYECKRCGKETD